MQQGENWILQQIFLYSFESFLFYKITSRHLNNETKCHHWIIGSRLKLVLSSLGLGRVVAVQHERYYHWKLKTIFNIPVKRACELTTQATLTRVIRPTVINSHQRLVQILMRVDLWSLISDTCMSTLTSFHRCTENSRVNPRLP